MTSIHSVVYFQFIATILIFVRLSLSNEFADSIETSGNDEHHRENINKTIDEQTTTKKTYESPYYKSEIKVDQTLSNEYWSNDKKFSVDDILSKSHRRAIKVELTFDFPFYGSPVRNVTVTSNGFLYIGGEYTHVWLAATQYIAPLMMNFDPSLSNVTSVKYADNGTEFTVIWEKVPLKDTVSEKLRLFTFGVTLYMSGDITFAYRHIPVSIDDASQDGKDMLKIGLSDAYIMPAGRFRPRFTIYEYDRLRFNGEDITNNTLIYIAAKPTCLQYTDCETCVNKSSGIYNCMWCTAVQRCSTGYDRKRSEWSENGCLDNSIRDGDTCAVSNSNIEFYLKRLNSVTIETFS